MSLALWLERSLVRGSEQIALQSGERKITYSELERLSRVAGHALLAQGVSQGSRVALHLEKSIECVAILLGAIRIGAAYVPLDTRLPEVRKRQLLELVKPALVVDSARSSASAWADAVPERQAESLLAESWERKLPLAEIPASTAAYLLFTSGTSGLPKAVEISQGAAFTFASWAAGFVELSLSDSIASVSGLHFDLSTFDLFAGLGSNCRVLLVPQGHSTFPAQLARLLEKEKITVLYTVPSTLTLLAEHGLLENRKLTLRIVISAGDLFPITSALKIRAQANCQLFNFYGPTETNVCTAFELPLHFHAADPVPIGHPVAGCECRILEKDSTVALEGKGELLVGGPTLMNGYFGEGEASPFLLAEGTRFYRTGDKVERKASGPFFFKGRTDNQVKSWGYRVHPAETEHALAGLAGVAQCVVVALPDENAGHLLHALVVTESGSEAKVEDFISGLRASLPSQLVPASLKIVENLPLTANGKVDRKAAAGMVET